MKWSQEDTMKFAALYRDHECLWNFCIPNYKNRNMRVSAIENIVDNMNKDGFGIIEAKLKIKNLRSTYHQEVLKIKKFNSPGSGKKYAYVPSMRWFDIFHSIMRHTRRKNETVSNFSELFEQEDTIEECKVDMGSYNQQGNKSHSQSSPQAQKIVQSHTFTSSAKDVSKTKTYYNAKGRKRRLQDLSVKNLRAANETLNQQEEINENDAFGKYVAKSLNKLSLQHAVLAQSEIQSVLTRYRLLPNTPNMSCTSSPSN